MDLVITSRYGRLGNRLFLYAHTMGCALTHGVRVINPCFESYAPYFKSISGDPLCRFPSAKTLGRPNGNVERSRRHLASFLEKVAKHWPFTSGPIQIATAEDELLEFRLDDPRFLAKLSGQGYMLLRGYFFRDYYGLISRREEIVPHFELNEPYYSNVRSKIEQARHGVTKLVGVHIRRGDYRDWQGGRYYYDDNQYINVLKNIQEMFYDERVRFLIASDEKIALEKYKDLDCQMSTGHMVEDMYCLSDCDLVVGPFSTYSSWSSYYGDTPIYFIDDPEKKILKPELVSYEQFCRRHMASSSIFPEIPETFA